MFHSARLKLTASYLAIIMTISIVFSVAFYNVSTREIQRIIRRIEFEQTHDFFFRSPHPNFPTIQTLEEAKQRLKISLILINGIIFILAGGVGYFLAGRTLQPIKEMVDEQNRFITDASHELRTPLTALKSEIEVSLRDKELTLSDAKKLLASNLEEVNNLQVLSDNLLQLAQFQKPNTTRVVETVSLPDIIEEAVRKVSPLAKKKHIEIQKKSTNYSVKGDKQNLLQLFIILLDNAIKYSPQKTIVTITAKTTDYAVLVTVIDQGIGIDKKDIPHIFDRFYRADTSRTKQSAPGYGLGLSIAKKIVDMHKGSITVKREKGKSLLASRQGTTFTIQLPVTSQR